MIRVDRVVTRGGDGGETSLGDGRRVGKDDSRIEAIGAVDEANAALGMLRLHTGADPDADAVLARIQNDLFDIGADLCVPGDGGDRLRVRPELATGYDEAVAKFNAALPPLTSFVLPGGTAAAATAHMARTLVRRAERRVVALGRADLVNAEVIRALNRLSDLLFVLARRFNQTIGEPLWQPGAASAPRGNSP